MASTALINGVNYSWGNLSIVIYGNIIIGITKISFKRKQHKENNYGWGDKPVSRGYGNYEFEGSVEMYIDELKKLIAAAPNGDIMQILPSDMQIVYAGSRVLPSKDVLQAFEFMEDGLEASQNDTKLLVSLPLLIADVVRT